MYAVGLDVLVWGGMELLVYGPGSIVNPSGLGFRV